MEVHGRVHTGSGPWAGPAMSSRLPGRASVAGAASGAGSGGLTASDGGVGGAVDSALASAAVVGSDGGCRVGPFGLMEAADFAGRVEELSRTVEYLQLIAAAAVDRTRKESASRPRRPPGRAGARRRRRRAAGSRAGNQDPDGGSNGGTDIRDRPSGTDPGDGPSGPAGPAALCVAADDGYRNTAEFLRARLRISAPEARRRLSAGRLNCCPARHRRPCRCRRARRTRRSRRRPGTSRSHAATIITTAMDRVRHLCLAGDRRRDGPRPDPDGDRERPRFPGPDRPALDRGPGPGRRRTLRGGRSAGSRARSSANPGTACSTWKSSPPRTSSNTSSRS